MGWWRRQARRIASLDLLLSFACLLQACGPRQCPPEVPHEEPALDGSAEEYGPGFDLAWLGPAWTLRYVSVREERTLVVDGAGHVSTGRDLDSLRATGFDAGGTLVADDVDRWYVANGRDVLALDPSGRRELLFRAKLPVERVEVDASALYVSIATDRTKGGGFSEIWRVPKRGGKGTLLHRSAPAPIVEEFTSNGQFLFVTSLGSAVPEWRRERVPVNGGRAESLGCRHAPALSDSEDDYVLSDGWLWRTRRRDGATSRVVETSSPPALVDDTSVYFILDQDVLAAAPKRGGDMEVLGSFSTDESAECGVCGAWRDSVCVRCSDGIHRVPKKVRPRGRRVAYHGGDALALSSSHVYWVGDSGLERMERGRIADDDVYDEKLHQTLLPSDAPEFPASRLVLDDSDLFFVSGRGGVVRLPISGGAPVLLYRGAALPEPLTQERPQHLIALADGLVYALDVDRGVVVRGPTSGGAYTVVATSLANATALLVDATTIYVLVVLPGPDPRREEASRLVALDKSTGAQRFATDVPAGTFRDIAATKAAVYVSLEGGELYRLPKDGSAAELQFPRVRRDDFERPALRADALSATEDRLFFTMPTRVGELREGARLPSMLATKIYGTSSDLAADERGVYFSEAQQFKWEHWTEVGMAHPTR